MYREIEGDVKRKESGRNENAYARCRLTPRADIRRVAQYVNTGTVGSNVYLHCLPSPWHVAAGHLHAAEHTCATHSCNCYVGRCTCTHAYATQTIPKTHRAKRTCVNETVADVAAV